MQNKLYQKLSNDRYHADKGSISTSFIKKMLISYVHANYKDDSPKKSTPAMELGTAFHALTLEGGEGVVVAPDVNKRTQLGKMELADFEVLHKHELVISQGVMDTAIKMHESVMSHPIASKLLTGGVAEQSIFWDHKGQQLRCRPDYYKDGVIIDLKSAQNASPAGFAKAVATYHYDLQEAIYRDGCATQLTVLDFIFVVTESTAPYLTAVYRLKKEDVALARVKYHELLLNWKNCNDLGQFPGYSDEILEIELPGWYEL